MKHSIPLVVTLGCLACCGIGLSDDKLPTSERDFAKRDGNRPSQVIESLAQIDPEAAHNVAIHTRRAIKEVECEGKYRHHLQGICTNDKDAIYWSFTTTLVKTDFDGNVTKKIEVANHHGDLCHHDGKVYVAVNLGRFNDPAGNADSWVYVYNAGDLAEVSKHEVQEVFHGAGGVGYNDNNFFVVGGLPEDIDENYVYQYDSDFEFVKKHVIKSGYTRLGIQTAAYARGKWFFGCYGDPKILLVTDSEFNMLGRHEFDCSLGIVGLPTGRFLSAGGSCEKDVGCTGHAQVAYHNEGEPLQLLGRPMLIEPASLQEKLKSRTVRIVDVRSETDYAKGHIPGAVRVDVGDWKTLALSERGLHNSEGWAQRIGALGIDSNTHVVVYGSRLTNSARIWWLLKYVGVKDVSLVNGGWDVWLKEKRPIETSAPKVTSSEFAPNFQADRLAEIDAVKASLTAKNVKVVDTRSDDEFASGRVPDAVHLEWKLLLDEDGRFKSHQRLKGLFREHGIVPAETAVCY